MSSRPGPASPPVMLSYKDALLKKNVNRVSHCPRPGAPVSHSDHLTKLKAFLCDLMKEHPDGLPMGQIRRVCPLLFDQETLRFYPSTKHLLACLSDTVRIQGVGVHTLVMPAPVHRRPVNGVVNGHV